MGRPKIDLGSAQVVRHHIDGSTRVITGQPTIKSMEILSDALIGWRNSSLIYVQTVNNIVHITVDINL